MLLRVHVITGASRSGLEKVAEGEYRARLHSRPQEGEANRELIELLAEHFGVSKSSVRLVRGHASREKIIEVAGV